MKSSSLAKHRVAIPAAQGSWAGDLRPSVEAVNALFANNPQLKRESIDALIDVTQNGDEEGLPHTAAIVQDKLGLPTHVAAFDLPWVAPATSMASTR